MKKSFRVATILGARPQFVKASPLSRALAAEKLNEMIIHTGQHYDDNMSEIFFREMSVPKAHYNLGVGGGSQGVQTGKMLEGLEGVLLQEKPDLVLLVGDTNSTLAGALTAAKLNIPIAHVEAGLRSFNRKMPEEINRLVTDHLSKLLFCSSQTGKKNLHKEGIRSGIHVTGDVMIDALMEFLPQSEKRTVLSSLRLQPKKYVLLTVHRPVNTDESQALQAILRAFSKSPFPVVFPVHPRTRQETQRILTEMARETDIKHIHLIEPVGYIDMLQLEMNARLIFTDSGGIQKEAFYLKVPCITLREETEWVETLKGGWNRLVGANEKSIVKSFSVSTPRTKQKLFYGKGHSSEKIAQIIRNFLIAVA